MMYDPQPELSSDLEWMLQGGRVDRNLLVEALITEWGWLVYQLAYDLTGQSQKAWNLTQQVFVSAVLNLYRYRGSHGLQVWLASETCAIYKKRYRRPVDRRKSTAAIAILPADVQPEQASHADVLRALDTLEDRFRVPAILRYGYDLTLPEIGWILNLRESEIRARIRIATREILSATLRSQSYDNSSLALQQAQNLESNISDVLKIRRSHWILSQDQIERLIRHVKQNLVGGSRVSQFLATSREIALIGIILILISGIIWMGESLGSVSESTTQDSPTIVHTVMVTQSHSRIQTEIVVIPNQASKTPVPSLQPPAQSPTPVPEGVLYYVQPGDTLELIADKYTDVSVDELLITNRLPQNVQLTAGQALLIPGRLKLSAQSPSTPVSPIISGEAPQELAIPITYDLPWLAGRINWGWNTLWLDVSIIDYGPQSYVGNPKVSRLQAWISDNQFLVLHGQLEQELDTVLLLSAQTPQLYIARPALGQYWFQPLQPRDSQAMHVLNYLGILFQSIPWVDEYRDGVFKVLKLSEIAGQETYVIQIENFIGNECVELWMDTRTGLTLAYKKWVVRNQPIQLSQLEVKSINYDVDFPQDLFDLRLPWRGRFASDHSGNPAIVGEFVVNSELQSGRYMLDYRSPLKEFDPSQSELKFQVSRNFDPLASVVKVDVFADKHYLKSIEFGNPWTSICRRSPDGNKIAYVSQPVRLPGQNASLHWFSLSDISSGLQNPLPGVNVLDFAFDHAGRMLAVFGFDPTSSMGSLYLVDTESGATQHLLDIADARSLAWSPADRYLAFLGRKNLAHRLEHLMILEVDTSTLIYDKPVTDQFGALPASPIDMWGIDFPVKMGNLDQCAEPPENTK